MSKVDIDHLRQWIGRSETKSDTLSVNHARLMAATLGLPQLGFDAGTPLPPLWHWLYFLEAFPPSELGRDGHPARGGFLPPVPLSNRMWAGGKVLFRTDLPLGAQVEKRSRIESVEHKQGRSGPLVFVTVLHELVHEERIAVCETHDIVYKEPSPPAARPAAPSMPEPTHSEPFVPNSTTLFRYSAPTFNGHRIHYDVDYCREVEGYDNLVIQGPLNATILAGHAEKVSGRRLRAFRYRALRPSLIGNALSVNAAPDGNGLTVWIGLPDGGVAMRAEAGF